MAALWEPVGTGMHPGGEATAGGHASLAGQLEGWVHWGLGLTLGHEWELCVQVCLLGHWP